MKRITFSAFFAVAICFGFGCDNKGGDNYSTSTEKVGSGEGDEIATSSTDSEAIQSADSAEMTTGAPTTPPYASDADFVAEAGSGGMLEVALGKVATQKASNAEVKKFGQHMVDDHSKANTELKSLAGKKKWTIPAKMNAEHQATYDRLSKLSGKEFDKEYMAEMITDHETDVALFDQATQKAQDTDLKAFASKTLPTLRMHLDMARETNNKVSAM